MKAPRSYVSTTNACKLCAPLGASLAFRGIEGAVPLLHGSQGCATYMRRYLISHFREPVDIASSSLGEKDAVYGGGPNLKLGIKNVIEKIRPKLIGIATTCLTETIGDDVPGIVREFLDELQVLNPGWELPEVVTVATPSYSGTHMEGFHGAVRALVERLAGSEAVPRRVAPAVNLLCGMVSPEDIRYLKAILSAFGLTGVLLPDISETLDGPALEDYEMLPRGGTPLEAVRGMDGARGTVEFGRTLAGRVTAGRTLEERFRVPLFSLGLPIGLRETDRFMESLRELSDKPLPAGLAAERGRLVDAYVDGHKYVAGKRALVYGEEDLVVGLTAFLAEIGIQPVLCASGGRSGHLAQSIEAVTGDVLSNPPQVEEGMDFFEIAETAEALEPDLIVGHSKGYSLARHLGVPLIRVGFPIHDRFGGQRILHVGYRGAQELLDRIVNALLERQQEASPVGYGYL